MALITPFTPAQLNRSNGIKFANQPNSPFSNALTPFSPLGDFNNDGIDDFLINRYSNFNNQASTSTFIFYGSRNQPPFPVDWDNLTYTAGNPAGGQGEFLFSNSNLGRFIKIIDDINGDQFKELLSTSDMTLSNTVTFGRENGFNRADISRDINLNGNDGFRFDGLRNQRVVGDLNGDGIQDFSFSESERGSIQIAFGTKSGFPAQAGDNNLSNGVNGFKLRNIASNDFGILGIASAGDVNGDRRDDLLLVGANQKKYILLSPAAFPAAIDLNNFPSQFGVEINTPILDPFQPSLLPIGDINNDGLKDLYLIANASSSLGSNRIIYGSTNLLTSLTFNNSEAVNGTTLLQNDRDVPEIVRKLGDVNGDRIDDFIIDFAKTIGEGRSGITRYSKVIFGRASGLGDRLDLTQQSGNGFDIFTYNPINIGDFNGDGINDIYTGNKIIFGSRQIKNLADDQVDGSNGIVVGTNLIAIGDINGDGKVDLAGKDFVIYGTNQITSVQANNDRVYQFLNSSPGRAYNHNEFPDSSYSNVSRLNFSSIANAPTWVYGGIGNDTLAGHSGYVDQLIGGAGADTFVFNGEFGQQSGKGFGIVWDFVSGVDKVQVNGTANDYFFVEDNSAWLDNPGFLRKTIDTSSVPNTLLARRDSQFSAVMIGAFSDVQLGINDLTFVPNTMV